MGIKPIFYKMMKRQIAESHSISAGLDYPGVGPEHSYLKESGRAVYESASDAEALEAFKLLCQKRSALSQR